MAKPPNLRTITAADLKNLQIDDAERQLYWNGQRVRSQIELTWPQTFIAAVGVVAGLATILNGCSSGLNSASTLVCSRGQSLPSSAVRRRPRNLRPQARFWGRLRRRVCEMNPGGKGVVLQRAGMPLPSRLRTAAYASSRVAA